MAESWGNWSGSLRFSPGRIEEPRDEDAVAKLVGRAAAAGQTVRVAGAGHSSTPLVETDGILVSLRKLQGVVTHDLERHEATIRAGMTLHDAGRALLDRGLALPNLGDVDVQTVAGAIATGTHGTGVTFPNLATILIGGRLVAANGGVVAFSLEDDPDLVRAARVSLGALGVLTEMRLRLAPAYQLRRREWCAHIDDCLAHFNELAGANRNVDFYWYPRRDEAKIRTMSRPEDAVADLPFARLIEDETDWSNEIIAQTRDLKFDEMEYVLPAETGLSCFQEVRTRVKARWRSTVGWRVLYRTVAPDDAYLSPSHCRASVTISLHQNSGLPFWDYFRDIEPIFLAHGGRPHWAKKHTLRAEQLRPRYPLWDRFLDTRRRLDPDGVFLTPYLRDLLGVC
jgi:FAD/FMN-containing dehydrogenase